jgi:drug/metabolite transporter (DMT)-like permease
LEKKKMTVYNEKTKGSIQMISACLLFCIMASLVKLVPQVGAYKISLWRFVTGLVILGYAALLGLIRLQFHNWKLLFVRGLFGGAAIVIEYFAIVNLGISKAMVLIATYVIFAYIFEILLLKVKPGVTATVIIIAATAGLYLVVEGKNGGGGLFKSFGFYEALAIGAAVMGGLVVVTIRKLHETDSSYAIYFSQCAIGLCIAAAPSAASAATICFGDGVILALIGITAAAGQLLMTQSYKYLPVRIGATLAILDPLFCFIAGAVIFSEPVCCKSILGTFLIISSCAAMVLYGSPERMLKNMLKKTPVC